MTRTPKTVMVLAFACAACGSSPDASPNREGSGGSAPVDAGGAPDGAAGAAGSAGEAPVFPAVTPSLPEAMSAGGPVIAAPKVVPVFFEPDGLEPSLTSFLTALAASDYWTAATQEYGVGALSIAAPVVVSTPPDASISDDQIQSWLAAQADGTQPGWPKADGNSLFALFYPKATTVTIHGKTSCVEFDGYHREAQLADGTPLVYAVLARCSPALDAVTVSAAHEIVEAATDPFYYTDPAYAFTDDDHFVWTLATVGEVTDLCEFEPGANAKLVGDFTVPRSWSNAAAAAGKDPCVPAVAGPYFGAQLATDEAVSMGVGGSSVATRGVSVPVGESRSVDVALFSNAPSDAIELEAFDESHYFGGPKELELSFAQKSGKNGDTVELTIKALAPGAYGGSILFLKSKLGAASHVWMGFVAN